MSEAARAPVKAAPAPKPALTAARGHVLQRKCACGTSAQGKCEKCNDDLKAPLQRHAANHQGAPAAVPPVVHDVLGSPGRPLDPSARSFMEPRFGHDFSGVRVHDDARAADSARAVNARAYTVGQHIAFDRGQYAPHTEDGRHLLAHELAHTVQQGGLQRSPAGGDLPISSESDASEREASAVADSVMSGARPAISARPSSLSLHRAPWGTCPAGQRLGASREVVYAPAEMKIADHYVSVRNKANVIYYKKALEEFIQNPPRQHKKMIMGMEEMFRSDKPRTRGLPLEPVPLDETLAAPPGSQLTEEDEPEGASAWAVLHKDMEPSRGEPVFEFLRPDIIDLDKREVYDVTTIGQADKKVAKIANDYVGKLNRLIRQNFRDPRTKNNFQIGGKDWTAGTSLKRPPADVLLNRYEPPKAICYGLTDFTLRPGVIVYEAVELPPGSEAAGVSEPYEIATKMGKKAIIDANFAPSATDLLNTGPNNMAAARIIRGLVLKTLKRGKSPSRDRITACVLSQGCIEMGGAPPIPIAITSNKGEIELKIDAKTRVISLAKSIKGFRFKSKHLSEGTITSLEIDTEEGVKGKGKLVPSLSIFKGAEFGVEFSEDRYAITSGLEEEKLKKILRPIPGAKMTKAQLALELYPEFRPSGELAMELKAGKRNILDASLKVTLGSGGGLHAEGTLNAYIPGVDKAEGKVIYDAGKWSAYAELQSTQMNLPYVTGGAVKAGFTEKGPYGDGTVDLEIPGGHKARVGLHYRDGLWFFKGKGEFHIKRIGTRVTLIIDYFDGKVLRGQGTVKGFDFKGLTGDITVNYEGKVGASKPRIWGDGNFDIKKGRVTGSLAVHLLETGNFSGEGKVSYEIRPGLVAQAGIIVDKDEKVTLLGELKFPDYQLFDRYPKKPQQYDIIPRFSRKIPVPFLSIGPLGVQAQIGAGLFVEYGIGPGVIKDGFIKAQINPLEEDPDPQFELGGRISVPMFFSITGFISGGLVLDVLIAEAGGKFVVSATAELAGEGGAKFWAKYAQGEFRAEVDVHLVLELFLKLCVTAHVWAEAGVWRFKTRKSKSWNLLDFTYRPGVVLGIEGLKKPLAYSSKSGFELPSLDDITWAKPKLDEEKMLKSGVDAAGGQADGPKPRPCPVIE